MSDRDSGAGAPRPADELPLDRFNAFSDGVFAIAITLLVLQIEVPTGVTGDASLWTALGDEAPDFTAFIVSFAVIGMYWVNSHRFMRTIVEYDRGLMLRTLLFLFFVVLIPFSSQLIGEYSDVAPISIVIYIVNLIGVAGASGLMERHVLRAKLGKPEYDWDTELSLMSTLFTVGVFALTIPLAFVLGPWTPLIFLVLKFDPYERRRNKAYKTER